MTAIFLGSKTDSPASKVHSLVPKARGIYIFSSLKSNSHLGVHYFHLTFEHSVL